MTSDIIDELYLNFRSNSFFIEFIFFRLLFLTLIVTQSFFIGSSLCIIFWLSSILSNFFIIFFSFCLKCLRRIIDSLLILYIIPPLTEFNSVDFLLFLLIISSKLIFLSLI